MAVEEEKPLVLDSDRATFSVKAAEGQSSQHTLMNQSSRRLAVKVKCSDNDHYRVQPVFSFCEPLPGAVNLDVYRMPGGEPREDKLVLQYADVSAAETDPRNAFTPGAVGIPELRIALIAADDEAAADTGSTEDGDKDKSPADDDAAAPEE